MSEAYVPDLGDLVWLSQVGAGGNEPRRRAALILSPRVYNEASGFAIACPVASAVKGYPFEVRLPRGAPVAGAVLADRLRSIDWRGHDAKFCGRVTAEVLDRVQEHLPALLGL